MKITGRIVRFALVGGSSTLLYAVLATGLEQLLGGQFTQASISFAAYAISALFSYCAHRFFTFSSNGKYTFEVPRFAVLTLSGMIISIALPSAAEYWLGLPMIASVIGVCIVIPVVNFIALNCWIFSTRDSSLEGS